MRKENTIRTMKRRNAFSPCRCSTVVGVGVLRRSRAFRGTYRYMCGIRWQLIPGTLSFLTCEGEFSRKIRGCGYGISKANPKREPPTALLHRAPMNGTFNAQSCLPEAMNWNSPSCVCIYTRVCVCARAMLRRRLHARAWKKGAICAE